ncbi:uncharacterized protein BKA55DRAFT_519701, partial [Fusarium redolens]
SWHVHLAGTALHRFVTGNAPPAPTRREPMTVVMGIAARPDTKSTVNALRTLAARLSGAELRRSALRSRARLDGTRQGEVTGATVATASLGRRDSVSATAVEAHRVLQSRQMSTAMAFS